MKLPIPIGPLPPALGAAIHWMTTMIAIVLTSVLAPVSFAEWIIGLPQEDRQAVITLLRAGQFSQLDQRYNDFQMQYENGLINDRDLSLQYQAFYDTSLENERYLNQWVTENPQSYPARLARGIYYAMIGGAKRGNKLAKDTPRENFAELSRYLDLSNRDVADSLSLSTKPIVSILQLLKSSQHRDGQQTNRMWLNYANRIDPKNYAVRRRYMLTLEPKWGGSLEEMWQFLKECQDQQLNAEHLRALESRIYIAEAELFTNRNERAKAFKIYKKALALLEGINNSDRVEALQGIVLYGVNTVDLELVQSEIDEILRLTPTHSKILGRRGWIRFRQGHFEEGLKDYSRAAELGDAYSQFEFGKLLYYGHPTLLAPNPEEGLAWARKSSAQGHAPARHFLDQIDQTK